MSFLINFYGTVALESRSRVAETWNPKCSRMALMRSNSDVFGHMAQYFACFVWSAHWISEDLSICSRRRCESELRTIWTQLWSDTHGYPQLHGRQMQELEKVKKTKVSQEKIEYEGKDKPNQGKDRDASKKSSSTMTPFHDSLSHRHKCRHTHVRCRSPITQSGVRKRCGSRTKRRQSCCVCWSRLCGCVGQTFPALWDMQDGSGWTAESMTTFAEPHPQLDHRWHKAADDCYVRGTDMRCYVMEWVTWAWFLEIKAQSHLRFQVTNDTREAGPHPARLWMTICWLTTINWIIFRKGCLNEKSCWVIDVRTCIQTRENASLERTARRDSQVNLTGASHSNDKRRCLGHAIRNRTENLWHTHSISMSLVVTFLTCWMDRRKISIEIEWIKSVSGYLTRRVVLRIVIDRRSGSGSLSSVPNQDETSDTEQSSGSRRRLLGTRRQVWSTSRRRCTHHHIHSKSYRGHFAVYRQINWWELRWYNPRVDYHEIRMVSSVNVRRQLCQIRLRLKFEKRYDKENHLRHMTSWKLQWITSRRKWRCKRRSWILSRGGDSGRKPTGTRRTESRWQSKFSQIQIHIWKMNQRASSEDPLTALQGSSWSNWPVAKGVTSAEKMTIKQQQTHGSVDCLGVDSPLDNASEV